MSWDDTIRAWSARSWLKMQDNSRTPGVHASQLPFKVAHNVVHGIKGRPDDGGECMRRVWYDKAKPEAAEGASFYSGLSMVVGRAIHQHIQFILGMWYENHLMELKKARKDAETPRLSCEMAMKFGLKLPTPSAGPKSRSRSTVVPVSGTADVIMEWSERDPHILEIKTQSGVKRFVEARGPNNHHLWQLACYKFLWTIFVQSGRKTDKTLTLEELRSYCSGPYRDGNENNDRVGSLLYFDRDNFETREFTVNGNSDYQRPGCAPLSLSWRHSGPEPTLIGSITFDRCMCSSILEAAQAWLSEEAPKREYTQDHWRCRYCPYKTDCWRTP